MKSNHSNACANKAIKKWKDRKHIRCISECDDSKIIPLQFQQPNS